MILSEKKPISTLLHPARIDRLLAAWGERRLQDQRQKNIGCNLDFPDRIDIRLARFTPEIEPVVARNVVVGPKLEDNGLPQIEPAGAG